MVTVKPPYPTAPRSFATNIDAKERAKRAGHALFFDTSCCLFYRPRRTSKQMNNMQPPQECNLREESCSDDKINAKSTDRKKRKSISTRKAEDRNDKQRTITAFVGKSGIKKRPLKEIPGVTSVLVAPGVKDAFFFLALVT